MNIIGTIHGREADVGAGFGNQQLGSILINKIKQEILPVKWVHCVFVAKIPGPEGMRTAYNGHQYRESERIPWVVFGTLAEVTAKISAVWETARAGRSLELREVDYYPNNYKPESRRLIQSGRYTE